MNVNLLAVLAAAVAAWLFGAVWYMSLGRIWRDALRSRREMSADDTKPPVKALIISFAAEIVMAYVFAGLLVHLGGPNVRSGVISAILIWVGFVATTLVTGDAYLKEKPTKTAIDAGHWLGVLLIQGTVLGAMG